MIGVIGAGVVGSRVTDQLFASGQAVTILDRDPYRACRLAALHSRNGDVRVADTLDDLHGLKSVVIAVGTPHAELAARLLEFGSHVVSCGDDLDDTKKLTDLDTRAGELSRTVVVGAAASPGLTGLLVWHLRERFDEIDEAHVAMHGTGGPDCARQHHRALSGQSMGWHDGEWLRRPGGSGRELCWFPEPVGSYDCYRSEMVDPLLLHRAMPNLQRVTARSSATRRDRFTSRLPMLTPPHAEGGMGAVRVEVRGFKGRARVVEVAGVAERVGQIAGVVAAAAALQIGSFDSGCQVLGAKGAPNDQMYQAVTAAGIRVHRFVGSS